MFRMSMRPIVAAFKMWIVVPTSLKCPRRIAENTNKSISGRKNQQYRHFSKCFRRFYVLQTIGCSKDGYSKTGRPKSTEKLFLPNVRYYLTRNASSTFSQLPLAKGESTDQLLGSTRKILLDHRGVVYTQKSTLNNEKEHIAALQPKTSESGSSTNVSFGIWTVDSDLHLTPTTALLPQSPIASLCTTKRGVVLGVLQSTDDEEYIPVLWMASTGTCIENTECFLVGISIIDLKRFQAGIIDHLVDLFASQFQVEAKNLRVLVGMTPSLKFPRVSGKQVLEIFKCERWKLTRQFQIVHMVGKRHTEQMIVCKKPSSYRKDSEVLARKTLGSVLWNVDISRLVAERLKYLGTVVLNSSNFPVSLLDHSSPNSGNNECMETIKQSQVQLTETMSKNILSAAISIP